MPKLNMKHKIQFVKLVASSGPEPDESETVIGEAWAAIRTFQGNEVQSAGITFPLENVRFIIRYMTGLDSTMEIKHGGKSYQITNIMNDNEENKTLTIIAHNIGGR